VIKYRVVYELYPSAIDYCSVAYSDFVCKRIGLFFKFVLSKHIYRLINASLVLMLALGRSNFQGVNHENLEDSSGL